MQSYEAQYDLLQKQIYTKGPIYRYFFAEMAYCMMQDSNFQKTNRILENLFANKCEKNEQIVHL